jgi:hypothetical protein
MCAWGKEELVVGAAKDASGVGINLYAWYMVVRLVRSMCRPHVQPSVCWGVLCICVAGVVCYRSGGVVSSSEYHCRRVLCIMLIAEGSRRLRELK